jgi:hypothetical protein
MEVFMPEEKKVMSDEEILFSDEEIEGIVIKPWSFGMLFEVSPSLEIVLDKMDEKGLIAKFEESEGFLSWTLLARLFTIAGPEVLKIISLTTKKPVEEVKSLEMNVGMKIATTIYNQNKERILNALKNVFSPPQK